MITRSTSLRMLAAVLGACALLVSVLAGTAGAATVVTEPAGSPYFVKLDASGRPVPFTVAATGFKPGSLVYVEQCDARHPSDPNWLPTRDCDLGSSPAAAIVGADGSARFPAGDPNHGFVPFVGAGPETLFHCLARGMAAPKDGLPSYDTCQVRVSSNNFATTLDQVFLPISFGGGAPSDASPVTAAKPGSGSSSKGVVVLAAVVAAVVILTAGGAFALRRSRAR